MENVHDTKTKNMPIPLLSMINLMAPGSIWVTLCKHTRLDLMGCLVYLGYTAGLFRSGNQIIERSITSRVDAQFIVTCIRQQNMTSEETILVGEDYANLIQRCNAIGEAYVLLNVDLDVISLLICYMQIVFRLEAKTCNNHAP
jgi:hypothetical protein